MENNSNSYKKYMVIGIALLIVLIVGFLYTTYAKYVTSISSDASMSVARWRITLNNQDITSGSQLSNVIVPVFPGGSNVASGVIAPTVEGYFDIVIDASDTDVSLRYTLTTSPNEDSVVDDLVVSGYSIDGGQRQAVVLEDEEDEFSLSDTILYDSQDKDVSIRIYLMWNDDAENGATMNNAADTAATQSSGTSSTQSSGTSPVQDTRNQAKINVNLNFVQLPN